MNFTSLTLIANTAWTLSETNCNRIIFYKNPENKIDLTSESTSSPYAFTVAAEGTKKLHGRYLWQAFLNDVFVDKGTKDILPNLADDDDPRGEWTIIYENLMEAYAKLSKREADEVTLWDGTHVKYGDRTKLLAQIKTAEAKMNAETGRRVSHKVLAKFY